MGSEFFDFFLLVFCLFLLILRYFKVSSHKRVGIIIICCLYLLFFIT